MKRKSIIWGLITCVMVAIMSAGFSACNDDDDNGSSGGVVGTWSGLEIGGRDYLTLTFKSSGSGTWTYRDHSSSGYETERGSFTYEMEGKSKGIISIRAYDSYSHSGYYTDYMYFEIEGKKMYLYDDYYGEDLEYILTKE